MSGDQYAIPKADKASLPACHAQGSSPEGYDGEEIVCANCLDKFTCLPAAVKKPIVWTGRGVRAWRLDDDIEVVGVLSKKMTFAHAQARMLKRDEFIANDRAIPESLQTRPPETSEAEDLGDEDGEDDGEADEDLAPHTTEEQAAQPDEDDEETEDEDEEEEEDTMAPKKKSKPAAKPVKAAKPAKAAKPGPRTGIRSTRATGGVAATTRGGKTLAHTRTLSADEMGKAMSRIAIGAEIEFKVGMQIVRKTRNGEVVVVLKENGFLYDDKLWSSLSGAAMAATRASRSGNDFFSLKSGCTEVRNAKGQVIASKHKLLERE